MVSSLAAQLAQGASLNASLLADKSRRRPTESYLFTAKEAQQHDLDAIYALGVSGFMQLKSVEPELRQFEKTLFSEAAKATDRTLQSLDANAELDRQLGSFLPLLGPYLMDAPAGKILEWLVRRFRINEFNVQDVLVLFLPYHESPHFAKMVTILHINDQSKFHFLKAYKTTAKPIPRSGLVTEMLKTSDLSRFISGLLPNALKQGGAGAHKALIIFHTSVLLDFIARSANVDEGTTAYLLPASMEPLQLESDITSKMKAFILQESILGSLLILAAISQRCQLTTKALKAVLTAVSSCAAHISAKQFVRTLLCICTPQDEPEKLPRALVGALLRMHGVGDEIKEGLDWVGAEKLINPLVAGLVSQLTKEPAVDLLESIIAYTELPASIVRRAVALLLHKLLETDESADNANLNARKLLSNLHQRHPQAVQEACEYAVKEDEDKREAIEQLVGSISMALPGTSKSGDMDTIVASVSAESNVRTAAVRDLFNALSSSNTLGADIEAVKTALRLRVQDNDSSVIEALYARPAELVPLLLEDPAGYISSLVHVLHDSKSSPSRNVVRLHLSFLTHHFFSPLRERDSALAEKVVNQLFFPYLLFSKPRQKTASAVWEILEAKDNDHIDHFGIGRSELLGGCVDAVRWEEGRHPDANQEDGNYRNVEMLTRINLAVAARMADNILASNNYSHLFGSLLERLQDSNPHSRGLGYLTVRALLSRLSGEHQINSAHQALRAMKLESLEGMSEFLRGVDNLAVFLHDTSVGTAVVLKPTSRHTLHRLQVSVLAMLPIISRPPALALDWLQASSSAQVVQANDAKGIHYVQLMHAVYKLSNSSASLPLLSTHLLRALFINLGADALAFLAGIWVAPYEEGNGEEKDHIRIAALRHAAAFLEADLATENRLDFQTILPAILVALQNADLRVREAALDCIAVMVKMSHSNDNVSAVYAFDKVYGINSSALQYIEWPDFQKYIAALGASQSYFIHDANYIRIFHQEHLTSRKSDSKKQAGYKQRILCYLLSHINACQLLNVKLLLLKSVETTSNAVKCQMLLPTIDALLEDTLSSEEVRVSSTLAHRELLAITVSSFDDTAVADLNDTNKQAWPILEKTLRTCFRDSSRANAIQILARHLQQGTFQRLSLERKIALCSLLLDISVQDVNAAPECKQLLSNILTEVPIMTHLLVSFQPTSLDTVERAPKRARVENVTQTVGENTAASLTLLAEILASKSLPGSLDLMSCLLETLNKVAHDINAVPADRSYIEQLLMTSVENAVNNVLDTSSIPPGAIRVDVLVELIRAAENPQTFHQALLLMAGLARLAPDAVLHNIMPIFTFMGSNVFHRDDTYSFRVVQKTIENIVPVMVASLKRTYKDPLDLYIGSRDFLRIFADAAGHIPRHRRAKFFSHLVDVLGPDEFLAPVCLLLVDKAANRVVRQTPQDARGSLLLPLTTLQQYSAGRHHTVMMEAVREVQRLLTRAASPSSVERTFLSPPPDDEQSAQTSTFCKRRALALLIFCDNALRESSAIFSSKGDHAQTSSSEFLSLLLGVAVAKDVEDIRKEMASVARSAMASTLRIMSASDFLTGILTMINSRNVMVQIGALELLGERLPSVADRTRHELTTTVVQIVHVIRELLASKPEEALLQATLVAIRSISQTMCPGEEGALMTIVPQVLDSVQSSLRDPSALSVLLLLCSKLGPRIIPHIKSIVQECVAVVRKDLGTEDSEGVLPTEALAVLQNILTTIPTFWADNELVQVINLYLDSCVTVAKAESSAMTPVMKTMAKRIPSKALLSILSTVWSSLKSTGESAELSTRCIGYFVLMKRSLRAAARPVVLEQLRQLFKIYEDAFDMSTADNKKEIEPEIIASFLELVVKLNETAFRPLFRKLSDWAFVNEISGPAHARQVVFCYLYSALLDYFKALMVPYMSYTWQSFLKLLKDYSSGTAQDPTLWVSALEMLNKTFTYDEGVFWHWNKLEEFVPALVKQIPACIDLRITDGKSTLSDCLVAAAEVTTGDKLLKSMNMDILMYSRAEDVRLRLYSLTCSEAIWRAHGGKLLGFVAETTTFIAECAEDENDTVVRAAHSLKDAVESIAGKIDV